MRTLAEFLDSFSGNQERERKWRAKAAEFSQKVFFFASFAFFARDPSLPLSRNARFLDWARNRVRSVLAIRRKTRFNSHAKETFMNETDTAMNQESSNKFEAGKAHAKQAAEELRAAAEEKAAELRSAAETKAAELRTTAETKAHEYRAKAEETYEQARVRARSLQEEGEAYVRENPLQGVLTALGVGFVLGLLFRR